jgi:effector-binding domain-containing protein
LLKPKRLTLGVAVANLAEKQNIKMAFPQFEELWKLIDLLVRKYFRQANLAENQKKCHLRLKIEHMKILKTFREFIRGLFYYYVFAVSLLSILTTLTGCTVMANYESAYKMTGNGDIEVKKIPESTVLQASEKGEYYDKANNLFIKLFNYIRDKRLPMTIPVESGIKEAEMRFYVSADKKDEDLKDTASVKVLKIPERTVVASGGRGSYSESNIADAKKKLILWLKAHPEYEQVGEPYAVYWNSPFRLWFLKHYEVHMPVKQINGTP